MKTKAAVVVGAGLLFVALSVKADANPVPYDAGEGTGWVKADALATVKAPAKKLPPHPVAPVTAVFDASGRAFPAGGMSLSLNYLFSRTDTVRFHGSDINRNTRLTKNLAMAKLRYGIVPGLDIRSETPLYLFFAENSGEDGDKTMHFMGDTTIVVHKVVISQEQGRAFDLALDFGATLPTAEVNDDSYDFLGTGNWGMLAGVGASWFYGRHRFDGEVNFASFKEGKHNYRKPDRCRVNLGWSYIVNPALDFGIESNYEWNGQSERQGKKQYDSFIEWFIGPKAAYRLPQYNAILGSALTFPAYRYYDMLTPADNYRFELKFAKFF